MSAVAITGGIATGKSTFTRLFAAATGAPAFDTDACARRLLENDADALTAVRAEFGPGVFTPDGAAIDRAALRAVVFGDSALRRALEEILHPRVRAEWQGWLEGHLQRTPDALLVVEIPLLYETGAAGFFDQVIVVGCGLPVQMRRLIETRRLSEDMARQIIASQLPLTEKISQCHHLIWNDGSEDSLQAQAALCAAYYQSKL